MLMQHELTYLLCETATAPSLT